MAIISVKTNPKKGTVTLTMTGKVMVAPDVYCRENTMFVIDSKSFAQLSADNSSPSFQAIKIAPVAGAPCSWMNANIKGGDDGSD